MGRLARVTGGDEPGLFGRLFRRRREAAPDPSVDDAPFGGEGVLAVKGLKKSYRGRTVVQDAALRCETARRWVCSVPTARARLRSST
jgi:hypothetical protein